MDHLAKKTASAARLAAPMILSLTTPLLAENRFICANATITLGTADNPVSVSADTDQDTYGFQFHIEYDPAKILVTAVEQGAAIAPLEPEFFDGQNEPGCIFYGISLNLTPPVDKVILPGDGQEILRLRVRTVAVEPTTVLVDLIDRRPPGIRALLNVMVNANGERVVPELVDGTLTLADTFVRGDADGSGTVNLSDAVLILADLFRGLPAPAACRDALDADDSGLVDISDAIYSLDVLFLGIGAIPEPYPDAGADPTLDELPECGTAPGGV